MWYKTALNGIGGGAIFGGETKIVSAPKTLSSLPTSSQSVDSTTDIQSLDERIKAIEEAVVNQTYNIGGQNNDEATNRRDIQSVYAPAQTSVIQSLKARRLDPELTNPEFLTYEEQLESSRQQNVNRSKDEKEAKSQEQESNGEFNINSFKPQLIKGIPQYNQGKGRALFNPNQPATLHWSGDNEDLDIV